MKHAYCAYIQQCYQQVHISTLKLFFLLLYLTATCLDQPRDHLQGYKIQSYIRTLYL